MPLFNVQDGDRPMWVRASTWGEAVASWRRVLIAENPDDDCSESQPAGVSLVAEDYELIDDFRIRQIDRAVREHAEGPRADDFGRLAREVLRIIDGPR